MRYVAQGAAVVRKRDWRSMVRNSGRLLKERTGDGVKTWNRRIRLIGFLNEKSLREWLARSGVKGYPQDLLVMERFGYPDFLTASAAGLIDGQYADRPHLRPIFEAVVQAASRFGEVTIQARKGYVSLVTPRRTFARVRPTTRSRVDLGLRLEAEKPGGRLKRSDFDETMKVQVELASRGEVDPEVLSWLRKAFEENS